MDVTGRRRAEREREQLNALKVVSRAQTAERERISRDLHDRVAHDLAVVHQSLQLFDALRNVDPARAERKLGAAQDGVRAALDATRNLASKLRRSEAVRGLRVSLEEFAEAAKDTYSEDGRPRDVRTQIVVLGDETLLPEHVRNQAYLILREGVRNALKHSSCSEIRVSVEVSPSGLVGTVEDDGRGFDPNGLGNSDGIGLKSMRERAELLGGTVRLRAVPARGTWIELDLLVEGQG